MGVQGLWALVESAGKPTPLESLENKVLAVDVSIWLNQAVRGMRDNAGAALPNAHVLGLFHRVCKLLFYRIRPVFVFDGPPPALKRTTLAARRRRRGQHGRRGAAARAKIVENFVKKKVVAERLKRQTLAVEKVRYDVRGLVDVTLFQVLEGGQEELAQLLGQRNKAKEKDLFDLPPLPDDQNLDDSDSDREDILAAINVDHSTDLHQVGQTFLCLFDKAEVLVNCGL